MTKKVVVFPWKMQSTTAKRLAESIGVRKVFPDKNYKPLSDHVIINWGNSKKPLWWQAAVDRGVTIINKPDSVAKATNKLKTFEALAASGVRIPEFTTDRNVAFNWATNDGPVCCRNTLNGHSAAGLVIVPEGEHIEIFPNSPLYTKYVKKKDEYRVHVFMGNIIDITKKRLRNGMKDNADYKVRNYSGGWIYAREGIDPPADVLNQAQQAILSLGLDFGAVDVGWNDHYQEALVYEVNSAPGLVGTTLYRYASALVSAFPQLTLHLEEPENDFEGFDEFDLNDFIEE